MADEVKMDVRAFQRRARLLLDALKSGHSDFAGADALCFLSGTQDDAPIYSKSLALQTWLLGYEFPDTITAVTQDKFIFVTTVKKGAHLESLRQDKGVPFEVLKRTKDEAFNETLYAKLLDELSSSKAGKKLGVIVKDEVAGKNVDGWKRALKASGKGFEEVDVSAGLAVIFAAKDEDEIRAIRQAAKITSATMKNFFIPQMSSIIDQGKKVSHEKLMQQVEDALLDEVKSKKLRLPPDAVSSLIDWCYPPIIQSGGKYDLRPSAVSNEDNLHEGTIVCSFGARYKSYCSNIGRTFLMNPREEQEVNYKFLLDLQTHLLANVIKEGVSTSEVHSKAIEFIEQKRPDLKSMFVKNCGFLMGIEFRESSFQLAPKTPRQLKANMIINLAIGFQGLENTKASDARGKTYALFLADTVQVTNDAAVVLTEVSKDLGSISYTFGDDEDSVKEKVVEVLPKKRGAVIESKLRDESDRATSEQKRRLHQKQLAKQRHDEGISRFSDGKDGKQQVKKAIFSKFDSYKKESQLPSNISEMRIIIDRKMSTILLPIFGQAVPFHISTIKNLSKSDEQDSVHLRFNFITPGQSTGKKDPQVFEDPNATFVRSLSYRSNDTGRMAEIFRQVNELKKEMQKREAEANEMADLVEQANLMEVKGRRPTRLPDVYVRPGLEGKRFAGDLEIHLNGLRYQSQIKSDQKIDILFSNIKHLFFQPCDGELIVLLHVHLKNPIMIGKKKTKDVQFYREVSDASFDETGNRRRRNNYGDEDELAQEQEERRKRQQLNREFQQFSEKISETSKGKVDVDVPFRDLGFTGVPHRQLVLLQPTTDCLVHLSDMPFVVLTLADVEIAHLERVQFGLKNFDLVFVFKDFTRPVFHFNTIPVEQLENVKEWLDSTINEDPKHFFEEAGGWSFLQPDSDDDDSQRSESGSEFGMSGSDADMSESESEESDYDSDASASDSESSGSGSGDDGSGESSGDDWDELERKAEQDDRKRRVREEGRDEDERRPNAKKGRR
ncbi:FACT complex subunit-domain-containing protein [Entophlyctis helioformis]|nr:FACT complex subunit-domain-containing protein [Entophlyctis helioformis]